MRDIQEFLENASEVYSKLPILGQFGVLAGAFLSTIGAIAGVTTAIENRKQRKDLKNLYAIFDHLDNNPSHVLGCISDGINQGIPQELCEQSKQVALNFSLQENTRISYGSEHNAAKNHLLYRKLISDHTSYMIVGGVTIPRHEDVESYRPVVIGWQASKENPLISVPLYSGPRQDMAVRYDGKQFVLPEKTWGDKPKLKPRLG